MFHLGTRYWLSNKGALCSDQYAYPVTDKDECPVAFASLQVRYPSTQSAPLEGKWAANPKGCFVWKFVRKYTFFSNKHSTGSPQSDSQQICKGK